MQRRGYMSAVAALAATKWAAADYDIEDAEEWKPATGGHYFTGRFAPSAIDSTSQNSTHLLEFRDGDFSDRVLNVQYDEDHVNVVIEGRADGGVCAGALAELSPEQAKELAATIYMAAEEQSRRAWKDHEWSEGEQ